MDLIEINCGMPHLPLVVRCSVEMGQDVFRLIHEALGENPKDATEKLASLYSENKIELPAIVEFQKKAEGKYVLEGKVRKKITILDGFPEAPYVGNLIKILLNDPKNCMQTFLHGVSMCRFIKARLALPESSDVCAFEVMAVKDDCCEDICAESDGRIFFLGEDAKVPHFLGCRCTLSPLIEGVARNQALIDVERKRRSTDQHTD